MINIENWHWPQYLLVALYLVDLGLALASHGKPKFGTHSIWVFLLAAGFIILIQYFGGFWA